MHLAYSAVNAIAANAHQQTAANQQPNDDELMLRYQAYQNTCHKYRQEIAAIQKYLPGWEPKFR